MTPPLGSLSCQTGTGANDINNECKTRSESLDPSAITLNRYIAQKLLPSYLRLHFSYNVLFSVQESRQEVKTFYCLCRCILMSTNHSKYDITGRPKT